MSSFCTVCNNSVKQSHISFFMYPMSEIKRLMWLKAVNREDLYVTLQDKKKRSSLKICEEHFEMKYIEIKQKKVLSDDAIPTLKLNKPCNPNISQHQNAIEESNDVICISMDERNINAFKIPTLQLGGIENSSRINIHSGMKETEKVMNSGVNVNSFPTINLEEKGYQELQKHSVTEDQRKVLIAYQNINTENTKCLSSLHSVQDNTLRLESEENLDIGQKNTEIGLKTMIHIAYINMQKSTKSLDFVKTFNEVEYSRKTHVWIPRDVISLVQKRLQLYLNENCRKMNMKYKNMRQLRVLREKLERKRTNIRRSLAILRKKYGLKDQKQRFKKPLQDPYAEIDLLDIKEEKINERIQRTETETKILNEDTQTSNQSTCVEVVRDPLPIKFEVFDETEEDTAPVHLMTSHLSMADPISSMSDLLMPAATTPVSITTNTTGQYGALDDFDKFALSLAKSMKNLKDHADKINLVKAMQNLVSEYVIRDLKKTFPNASFSSDAQNQDAVQTLISNMIKQSK